MKKQRSVSGQCLSEILWCCSLEVADVMASYFGEHCFSYSANLSMDLMNLNGRHLSAGKLVDAAQCGGWNDIVFVLYHCRKTSRKREEERRVEEVSHMFSFQVRRSILYYLYLFWSSVCDTCLCFAICRLYDEFRRTCKCVWIKVFVLTLLMLCFGVTVTNHELSKKIYLAY